MQILEIRQPFQKQDPLHQRLGVPHLLDALLAVPLGQLHETPVFTQLVVHHVLVDGRQLIGKDLVQKLDYLFVSLHGNPPPDVCLQTVARP